MAYRSNFPAVATSPLFYSLFYKRAKLEDFVTEILAASIREDPRPFFSVLQSAHAVPGDLTNRKLIVDTQVGVRGAGVIDLVLYYDGGEGDRAWNQIWVEVKVDSGESGDQLANYTAYIAKQPENARPLLVTLASEQLRKKISAITWQDLWDRVQPKSAQYWRDLMALLEELGMADKFGRPITADEIASLPQAVSLFNKAVRILDRVCEKAAKLWPQGSIPASGKAVGRCAAKQFKDHDRITVHSTYGLCSVLVFGIEQAKTTVDLVFFVEPYNITAAWVRPAILKQAKKGGLPLEWARSNDPSDWQILMARQPLQSFNNHDAACSWLLDRFNELKVAGLLKLIPTLGSHPADKSENDADE